MADASVADCGVFGCWARTNRARNIKSTKPSFDVHERGFPLMTVVG